MPAKRRTAMKGKGWGDFVDFFKKTIPSAVKSAHDFIKDNKIISTAGGLVGQLAPMFGPYGQAIGGVGGTVGSIAGNLGYGKKRRPRKAKAGRGKARKPKVRTLRI